VPIQGPAEFPPRKDRRRAIRIELSPRTLVILVAAAVLMLVEELRVELPGQLEQADDVESQPANPASVRPPNSGGATREVVNSISCCP
jgi:hypothetical protein